MEEKLNMIYEKILDLEIAIKDIENQKRIKELVSEKKEIEYRIDDLKYIKEKEYEVKAELMSMFRNAKENELEEGE